MKKIFLLIIGIILPVCLSAQVMKERRVYYLDCSYSMVEPNKIWDKVRENLKEAIDRVSDETTELMIIPFAFDNQHHSSLNETSAFATEEGKRKLKKMIDELQTSRRTMTYHSDPINDFYANRVDDSRVTYMFLMTDGQNEERPDMFLPLLKKWGTKYGRKNVYGFYVMLDESAKDPKVEEEIGRQSHLWKVETADVNINLIRLHPTAVYNARNDKYIDIPIYGHLQNNMSLNACFSPDVPYSVRKVEIKNGQLRVFIQNGKDIYSLPASELYEMKLEGKGGGKFDFLVTESVAVKCESKPERSLKISIRQ